MHGILLLGLFQLFQLSLWISFLLPHEDGKFHDSSKYALSLDNNTSLLDIEIETGRTHQIRAHLAHIGLPIIGDGKYGINEINKKFKVKAQKLVSYKLIFRFEHDSKILEYLNRKSFELKNKNI